MDTTFEFDMIADSSTISAFKNTFTAALASCKPKSIDANQARSYSADYIPEMITAITASATFALELAKFIADRFKKDKADKITIITTFTGPIVFRRGEHDEADIEQEIIQIIK